MNNCIVNNQQDILNTLHKLGVQQTKYNLNDLLNLPKFKVNTLDEHVQLLQLLKDYIKETSSPEELNIVDRAIKEAKNRWTEKYPAEPQVQGFSLDMNFSDLRLVSYLDDQSNRRLYNELTSEIIGASFFNQNSEHPYIVTVDKLGLAFRDYRNRYITTLCNFTGYNPKSLMWNFGRDTFEWYQSLIQQTITQLSSNIDINGKILKPELYNVVKALYIVTNLDSIIEHFSPKVKVKSNLKGGLKIYNDKFYIQEDSIKNSNYDESEDSFSTERITPERLKQIVSSIQTAQGRNVEWSFVQDVFRKLDNKLVNKDISAEEFIENLSYLVEVSDKDALNALQNYLTIYNKVFDSTRDNLPLLKQTAFIKDYDITSMLIHQLQSSSNISYIEVGDRDKGKRSVDIKNRSEYKDSKQVYKNLIKNTLKKHFESSDAISTYYYLEPSYEGIPVTDLSDRHPALLRYLENVAGIQISQQVADEFFDPDGTKIGWFLKTLSRLVNRYNLRQVSISSMDYNLDRLIDTLTKDEGDYIEFTNILSSIRPYRKTTLLSQDMKQLPGMTVHSTISRFKEFKENYAKTLGRSNFLYTKEQNELSSPIAVFGTINVGGKFLKATELSAQEALDLEYKHLYLPAINSDMQAYFQLDVFADKPRVFYGKADITSLYPLSIKELRNKLRNQALNYYESITQDILEDFKKLGYNPQGNTYLEQYLNFFDWATTNNINKFSIESIIAQIQSKGDNLELVTNKHFHIGKNGILYPNSSLVIYLNFSNERFADNYYNQAFEAFKDRYKSGINEQDLEKYFYIRNIVRDAYMQLTIQHPFFHDNKGKSVFTSQELRNLNNNPDIYRKVVLNKSQNDTAGKKRGNVAGSTFIPLRSGIKYGLPKTIRTATINAVEKDIFTYFKVKERQDVHDGQVLTPAIVSEWETASYTSVKPKGSVRKHLFLGMHLGHVEQVKCADYRITNAMVRDSQTDNERNYKLLLKKCYSPANLDSFKTNLKEHILNNSDKPIDFCVYYYFGTRLAKLTSIGLNDENNLVFDWRYVDFDSKVPNEEIQTLFDSDINKDSQGSPIVENLYQLWQAFGGEFALDFKEDKLGYSENNNSIVASLISALDSQDIKETAICKLFTPSALKSGATNTNSTRRITDPKAPLLYHNFNTSDYGLQQDYTHIADEQQTPAPTQVLQTLAFDGNNVEYCEQIYKAFATIVNQHLNVFKGSKAMTDKWLAKKLLHAFKNNNMSTSGESIISSFIKSLEQGKKITLPASSPDIYYKLTSDILSDLNHVIKQSFAGAQLIQNPSYNIVMMYDDNLGNKYTRSALYTKAREMLATSENFDTNAMTPTQQLEWLFNNDPSFKDTTVYSISELNLEDHVIIPENNEGINPGILKITDPDILYKIEQLLKNGIEIKKHYRRARNLGTTKITWDYDNVGYNYWTLWSTKKWLDALKSGDKSLIKEAHILDAKQRNLLAKGQLMLEDGSLVDIDNYKYTPGEQVASKIFKSRYNINGDHSEINNLEHFIEIVKDKYTPTSAGLLAPNAAEYCICVPNSDVTNSKNQEFYVGKYTNQDLPINDNVTYVTNELGKIEVFNSFGDYIFTLPDHIKQSEIKINATVDDLSGKEIIKIKTDYPEDFLTQIDHKNAVIYGKKTEFLKRYNRLVTEPTEDNLVELAKKLHNSYKLSNLTISVRIPTQHYQSFMVNDTVAFIDDDENNVYNNVWEMVFQGSDFDIDKAYTIAYSINNSGLIAGNIFTDYNSAESIRASLQLPTPDFKNVINDTSLEAIDTDSAITNLAALYYNKDEINNITRAEFPSDLRQYAFLKQVMDLNIAEYNFKTGIYSVLMSKINEYNGWKSIYRKGVRELKQIDLDNDYLKNIMVEGIINISSDIRNLKQSQEFTDADPMKRHIDLGGATIEYEEDPTFIIRMQKEFSVGKQDVGIGANGLKSSSVLQHFYNKKTLRGEQLPDYNLKVYFPKARIDERLIHSIANLNALKEYELQFGTENTSSNLAMFLGLAVDNAKELALAKIYGTPTLLKFHVALSILGFSAEEIVNIGQLYLGEIERELENTNRLDGGKLPSLNKVIDKLTNTGVFAVQEAQSIKDIFSFGNQLTMLSTFLKINQQVDSHFYDFAEMLDKFQTNIVQLFDINDFKIRDYITDFEYRENINNIINDIIGSNQDSEKKVFFNPLEVVTDHPLFNALMTAIATYDNFIQNNISKAYLYSKLKSDTTKGPQVLEVINDFMIGTFLKELDLQLNAESISSIYGTKFDKYFQKYGFINLSTNQGLRKFIDIMESDIIPNLRNLFEDNAFFVNLSKNAEGYYTIPVSVIDTEQSPLEKLKLETIKSDFEKISQIESYVQSSQGELTLGDLFYLYQLVTNKNKFNSALTYCVRDGALNTKLQLPKREIETTSRLDSDPSAIDIEHLKPFVGTEGNIIVNNYSISIETPIKTLSPIVKDLPIDKLCKDYFKDLADFEMQGDTLVVHVGNNNISDSLTENIDLLVLKDCSQYSNGDIIQTVEKYLLKLETFLSSHYAGLIKTTVPDNVINTGIPELDALYDKYCSNLEWYQTSGTEPELNLPKVYYWGNRRAVVYNSPFEKGNIPGFVLDVCLQAKSGSSNALIKMLHLIEIVTGVAYSPLNWTQAVEEHKDTLQKSDLFKIGYEYFISEQGLQFPKSKIRQTLSQYSMQIQDPDIYYQDAGMHTINTGDYITKNGVNYLVVASIGPNVLGLNLQDKTSIESISKQDIQKRKEPLFNLTSNQFAELSKEYRDREEGEPITIGCKINGNLVVNILYNTNNNIFYLVQTKKGLEKVVDPAKGVTVPDIKYLKTPNLVEKDILTLIPGVDVYLNGNHYGYITNIINNVCYLSNGLKLYKEEILENNQYTLRHANVKQYDPHFYYTLLRGKGKDKPLFEGYKTVNINSLKDVQEKDVIYDNKGYYKILKKVDNGFLSAAQTKDRYGATSSSIIKLNNNVQSAYSVLRPLGGLVNSSYDLEREETLSNFLQTLSETAGVPITIEIDPHSETKAKLTEDGITIFVKDTENAAEEICKEATHEYLHLLLAYVRKVAPIKYWELLKTWDGSEIEGSVYETDFSRKEEAFVQATTKTILESKIKDEQYNYSGILLQLNSVLNDVLGFKDVRDSLYINLLDSKFASIDFTLLSKNVLSKDIFSYITC